jgi:hypothetical protein
MGEGVEKGVAATGERSRGGGASLVFLHLCVFLASRPLGGIVDGGGP